MPIYKSCNSQGAQYSVAQTSVSPSDPATVTTLVAGADELDPANGGYITLLNGYSEVLNSGPAFEILPDGRVKILRSGIVKISWYTDVGFALGNTIVGAVFSVLRGATTILSPRPIHGRLPVSADPANISGVGCIDALVGDIIGIAFACTRIGVITVTSSSIVFEHHG